MSYPLFLLCRPSWTRKFMMLQECTSLVNCNRIKVRKMCWCWRPAAFYPKACNGQFCQHFSWNPVGVWDCYWPTLSLHYPCTIPSTTIYLLLYNHISIKAIFLRPKAMAAGVLLCCGLDFFFAETKIKQQIRPKNSYHTSNNYKIWLLLLHYIKSQRSP